MDIYAQLLDLLAPKNAPRPLRHPHRRVPPYHHHSGHPASEGAVLPRRAVFRQEDVGRELLVLPCEEGIYLAGFVEGGTL